VRDYTHDYTLSPFFRQWHEAIGLVEWRTVCVYRRNRDDGESLGCATHDNKIKLIVVMMLFDVWLVGFYILPYLRYP
jgi:hypothetical protein